jgi:hypothetical protein
VAAYDRTAKKDSIFEYDIEKGLNAGFVLKNLNASNIMSVLLLDDNKILLYQTKDGIFALCIQ